VGIATFVVESCEIEPFGVKGFEDIAGLMEEIPEFGW
jgi:hypothetical protein